MEFSERKRSRKSQSFKLVNQDYQHHYVSDTNGGSRDTQYSSGDESLEIKKQITGMRRLLNDSTGRIYQRVGKEGDQLKEERQDLDISWAEGLSIPSAAEEPIQPSQSSWSEVPIPTPDYTGQYGTRSKTVQNHVKNTGSNGGLKMGNSLSSSKCCTCNCQPTLQAILQELKAMRKFMQVQAVAQSRQQIPPSCACSQKTIASRKRITKKKVLPKTLSSSPLNSTHSIPEKEHRDHRPALLPERSGLSEIEHVKKEEDHVLGFGIVVNSSSSDPEVQLAEGFDVFMPKSQLDSILSNYKRSGSLLFRKLVCAFFDDKTLATSLPNGKRKRGLNDNRQGLDQNIVGAIKVFTEKYCTANNVEKVPGPRHWVQILQDQIKLARRRLKRGCDLGRSSQVI
ncbi:BEN domain-containing protein 7 isoform X2 [Spea bombifrons]|uniref:BEN domain-containing protein 7 isoform X2 n=1 Tax=Spea bombifrons TaxID=233779 RepID=UPI00234A4006|nr:BEN domain-containing protein 7 isoform X2 [Spea bombifrons]